MIARTLLVAGLLAVSISSMSDRQASAGDPYAMTQVWSHNFAMDRPWHGGYYQQQYGQPLALVVPPTAHMRQSLSWGVSQNTTHAIHHQFGRSANSPGVGAQGNFRHLPGWPSHTDQFGMYYVRGPW